MPSRSELSERTRYVASEVEARVFARWEADGHMHPEPAGTAADSYSIAIPPPNVTGALHMGHALNASVQDTLIRHARMRGANAKWTLGTDHASIAVHAQMERALAREGTTRQALGRDEFVRRTWRWRERYGGTIVGQLKRLGASADYAQERFTMDERYVDAVLKVFVALYEKGLVYRDHYMVNWDPGSRSAISDLEVEEREETDTLYSIDYPLQSGNGSITVATVRPETMLADTAIAVHPDDERYTRLVGETAILPLIGRRLTIVADPYVKPEFGTGALKITPGHDPNDFEIGRAHGLPEISVIGEDGLMTAEAGDYVGLPVLEARERVVADLRRQGLISRQEAYTHAVPFSQRSGERIEPLISLQWFARMDELAAPAIEAVRSGRIAIHPERPWTRVYLEWLERIRPWCISRQLWWGHRLPVYYRGEEVHVGLEPPSGEGWERDPDVLDTWFSSGLWPFATLGWPEDTPELRAFYPTDALVTGRDILHLWVARMVMLGLEFTGDVPFTDVYITSIIQAPDGRRMSKSLGTGIDPLDLIDGGERPPVFGEGGEFPAYGADAVRWGLLAMSSTQDVRFSEDKIAQGAQLTNKLFNASRLVLLAIDEDVRLGSTLPAPRPPTSSAVPAVEDAWIVSRLQRAKREIDERIEAFEFSRAALALYDFVYRELCDWYLELIKPRLYGEQDPAGVGELALGVLAETLALAHPVIPFATEELWGYVPGAEGLLATTPRPPVDEARIDAAAEAEIERVIAAVTTLRGWRESIGAAPGARVPARLEAAGYERTVSALARLARLELRADAGEEPGAVVTVPGGSVAMLRSGAVDLDAAARRREAAGDRLRAEIARAEGKLANDQFVARAPGAVVQGERDKLERLRAELDELGASSSGRDLEPMATESDVGA